MVVKLLGEPNSSVVTFTSPDSYYNPANYAGTGENNSTHPGSDFDLLIPNASTCPSPPPPPPDDDPTFSKGEIAGIVIGSIAAVSILGILIYYFSQTASQTFSSFPLQDLESLL